MTSFDNAITLLLRAEGGFHLSDSTRGAVNHGITAKTLRMLGYEHSLPFIRSMTVQWATDFYRTHYWIAYRLGDITSHRVAATLLLALVNTSPSAVIRLLQRSVNEINGRVVVDGIIGPRTIAAVNSLGDALLPPFKNKLGARYALIASSHPDLYARYLNSWLGRLKLT